MKRSLRQLGLAAAGAVSLMAAPAPAQLNPDEPPAAIRGLEVTEKLGAHVPMDLRFMDWTGTDVPLSKYFASGKPVILVLGYYDCPLVCPLIGERLLAGLNGVDYTVGEDFGVVYVSFDPGNTTQMAAAFRKDIVDGYQRERTAAIDAGWAFHTSQPLAVRALADSVGYDFRYLEESGEYSHPVALVFLSGDGRVSRYIYGFDYTPRDLKMSLLDASQGAIAQSLGDRLLWFCFHYDASTGRYSLAAFRVMQVGALGTVVVVGALVLTLKLGERARRRRAAAGGGAGGAGGGEGVPRGAALAGHRA